MFTLVRNISSNGSSIYVWTELVLLFFNLAYIAVIRSLIFFLIDWSYGSYYLLWQTICHLNKWAETSEIYIRNGDGVEPVSPYSFRLSINIWREYIFMVHWFMMFSLYLTDFLTVWIMCLFFVLLFKIIHTIYILERTTHII